MSNHVSSKSIILHHNQVNSGKARRVHSQEERIYNYMIRYIQTKTEHLVVSGFCALGIAYIAMAVPVYLGYVFSRI